MSTMNLKALHDEVAQIIPDHQPFSIELEVWNHRHAAGDVDVTVSIWDGTRSYRGQTPAGALEQLRAVYETTPSSIIPSEVILP